MDSGTSDPRPPVTAADAERRTWLQRHWKVVFPLAMGLMIALALGFTVLMLTIVMHPAKHSEAYREAVQRVALHPIAVEQLGQPIEPRWLVTGRSEETAGGSGVAELSIPLRGRERNGTLHVIGRRREGVWTITRMELEVEKSPRRFDLLTTEDPG